MPGAFSTRASAANKAAQRGDCSRKCRLFEASGSSRQKVETTRLDPNRKWAHSRDDVLRRPVGAVRQIDAQVGQPGSVLSVERLL
jgi:hypothetical protein